MELFHLDVTSLFWSGLWFEHTCITSYQSMLTKLLTVSTIWAINFEYLQTYWATNLEYLDLQTCCLAHCNSCCGAHLVKYWIHDREVTGLSIDHCIDQLCVPLSPGSIIWYRPNAGE